MTRSHQEQTEPQPEPTFADQVTTLEEHADALYLRLSELEVFAGSKAQANGSRDMSQAAVSLRLARSFVYQAFVGLRQLSGHLLGFLEIASQTVGQVGGSTPSCCPAWSLAADSWSWMPSPDDSNVLVQPSISGKDGTLLPLISCPFCGSTAPTHMRVEHGPEDEEVTAKVKVPTA